MTSAQHNAVVAHRRRRHERGMVRIEVQVPTVDAAMVRDLARILRSEPVKAQGVRDLVRESIASSKATSVFDLFGSDLPDEVFEGVFDEAGRRELARDVEL